MNEFIGSISDEQVNDDKTVVVVINSAVPIKLQPEKYYEEPNWAELKKKRDEEWRHAAYPHLFRQEPDGVGKDDQDDLGTSKHNNTICDAIDASKNNPPSEDEQLPEDWRDWDD